METSLCDELLQEIFQRLPSSSSSSISLVSKRWLQLYRFSQTSLFLRLTPPHDSTLSSLSTLLAYYPFLFTLSLSLSTDFQRQTTYSFADSLLLLVSSVCPQLRGLRVLIGPVSLSSIVSVSTSCSQLTSLCINLSRPLDFRWVANFPLLKELSIFACSANGRDQKIDITSDYEHWEDEDLDEELELGLESLYLSGIRSDDWGLAWLWRSSKKLQKLKLRSCEGIGDGESYSSFVKCLTYLQEVELRRCRSIVDGVLLRLAENSISLNSLLVYDGGSREGLLQFITHCNSNVRKLDLRLPLDLNNDHLSAFAMNFSCLSTLRLQSCCLITGEGLKSLAVASSFRLEELALINCDVVERESGLLSALGQSLRHLRKLDLSYNEMLLDKEFISMVVSCEYLTDLKLRGCKSLTNSAVFSLLKRCKWLENVDIMKCYGIGVQAVELFVVNSPRLRRIEVENFKLSGVARTCALRKFMEIAA